MKNSFEIRKGFLIVSLTTWSYVSRLLSWLTSTDLYNKVPFWCHFILTSLFVLQISRVFKSQALSLTFWTLDCCND